MSEIDKIFNDYDRAMQEQDDQANQEKARKKENLDHAKKLIENVIIPTLEACRAEVAERVWMDVEQLVKSAQARVNIHKESMQDSVMSFSCDGDSKFFQVQCVRHYFDDSAKSDDQVSFSDLSENVVREKFVRFLRSVMQMGVRGRV